MAEVWRVGDKKATDFERRLFDLLRDELAEQLPEYVLTVDKAPGRSMKLTISSPELHASGVRLDGMIYWRYRKPAFLSDWNRQVIGIAVRFDRSAVHDYRSHSRSYSYDFKNERLKPAVLKKLVAFVKSEIQESIDHFKRVDQNKKERRVWLRQIGEKLKKAGYTITVAQYDLKVESGDKDIPFRVTRINGEFDQIMKLSTSGQVEHVLGTVDLEDVANFVGCLEQTSQYIKQTSQHIK